MAPGKDEAERRAALLQPSRPAPPRQRPTPAAPVFARGTGPRVDPGDRRPNRMFRRLSRALALDSEVGLDALDRLLAGAAMDPATLTVADVVLLELGLRRLLDRGLSSLDVEQAHTGLDALLDDILPAR